ncbi:hypothetical protein PI125_g18581 [Phytophthora idaei]|nr:hypothetical protein PI125_g18581 [Phytophthora idaei]KAG3152190.1 hypothetical protein PI126_g10619 [Phytophthora idaei]
MLACAPGESALNTQNEDVEMVRAERIASGGINAALSDANLRVLVEAAEVSSMSVPAPVKGVRFESGNREPANKKFLVEKGLATHERKKEDGEKKTPSHARLLTAEEIDLMMQGSTIEADKKKSTIRCYKSGCALSTKLS